MLVLPLFSYLWPNRTTLARPKNWRGRGRTASKELEEAGHEKGGFEGQGRTRGNREGQPLGEDRQGRREGAEARHEPLGPLLKWASDILILTPTVLAFHPGSPLLIAGFSAHRYGRLRPAV